MSQMQLDPNGLAKIRHAVDGVGDKVSALVLADAKRYCPVKTRRLQHSLHRFSAGSTWYVAVGTDYWAPVEFGSRPHLIVSHGDWPLRNPETGEVFGRVVHHPGTPAQPFMRPAIYRTRAL